jgi:hypothetical protein
LPGVCEAKAAPPKFERGEKLLFVDTGAAGKITELIVFLCNDIDHQQSKAIPVNQYPFFSKHMYLLQTE